MLFTYSMGLGLPFILSALLIDYLKSAFNWIKSHYSVINAVCGGLLILIGLLMGNRNARKDHQPVKLREFIMQNKKTFITILLVFALVLGGSYLLYTKLSPLISADRISGQEQDTGDGSQESETEKILAPDITVYDINGNEVRLSGFCRQTCDNELLGKLVRTMPDGNAGF